MNREASVVALQALRSYTLVLAIDDEEKDACEANVLKYTQLESLAVRLFVTGELYAGGCLACSNILCSCL